MLNFTAVERKVQHWADCTTFDSHRLRDFAEFADSITDCSVFAKRADGDFLIANRCFEQSIGRVVRQPKHWLELLPQEIRPHALLSDRMIAGGGDRVTVDLARCIDGTRHQIRTTKWRIEIDGKPGVLGVNAPTPERQMHHGELEVLLPNEKLVFLEIARGRTSKEGAINLGLSTKSFDSYKYRLMKKLGVNDRVQIAHLAVRHGLVIP